MHISQLQKEAYKTADDHGFHSTEADRHVPTKLLLTVQELTEAFDEVRDGKDLTKNSHEADGKPVGFPSELADVLIRIADLAGIVGIDLEYFVIEKMEYNRSRPFKHGRVL
jgi:NTP pyrophosphatase (non-canonical NTP hydrolase)